MHRVVLVCIMFTCFFPLFSLDRPRRRRSSRGRRRSGVRLRPRRHFDDQPLAPEQTGKHPHFEHSDIAHSLLSHACIRIAAATALPILMYSLFIVTCLLPSAYPKLLSLGWVETI